MFGDRLPKGVDILPQAKRGGSVKLVCLRLGPFPRQLMIFYQRHLSCRIRMRSIECIGMRPGEPIEKD